MQHSLPQNSHTELSRTAFVLNDQVGHLAHLLISTSLRTPRDKFSNRRCHIGEVTGVECRVFQKGATYKSLYLVFLLQAVLAWLVSLPFLGAANSSTALGVLDYLGAALWVAGFYFETVGDWQLARFKRDPANQGRVMEQGLWRYTRHPNYFGDFCVWWGFFLIALGAGAWWSVIGPAIMTVLLMKVSGVTLLESDIAERRPEYKRYMQRTNAFFPGKPGKDAEASNGSPPDS